jgi:hypothetical protein
MQKLSRNISGKNNKSCITFHKNPTKLGSYFYDFSMIFYGFYKIRPKVKHYLRSKLSSRPLELLIPHKGTPGLQKPPWKELPACNWVLGHGGRRLRPKFRRGACRVGWGWVEDGPGLTTGRFGVEVGAEGHPAAGFRGAVLCRPRERLLRRGGCGVGKVSGTVSTSRRTRGWRAPQWSNAAGQALGSPRLPPMAPAGGSGRVGRAAGCGTRRSGGGTYERREGRPPLM